MLIYNASGDIPIVSLSRSTGGNLSKSFGGFSDFPNDWSTRIQLLFDWDDGFKRSNWDKLPFRRWTRYCFDEQARQLGRGFAKAWKRKIGRSGQSWLTILPRYESDKMYQWEKIPKNISLDSKQYRRTGGRGLKWMAARPLKWKGAPLGPVEKWEMMVQEGKYRTPNEFDALVDERPDIISGKRFDLIDEVMLAESRDSQGEDEDGEP